MNKIMVQGPLSSRLKRYFCHMDLDRLSHIEANPNDAAAALQAS